LINNIFSDDKDKELLVRMQHRYTKLILNMPHKEYKERLRCLRHWTLEERRNRQDVVELFKMYRGLSNVLPCELFILDENSNGTRGTRANWLRPSALGILPSIYQQMEFTEPVGL